jgi:hypothetical protein
MPNQTKPNQAEEIDNHKQNNLKPSNTICDVMYKWVLACFFGDGAE